MRLTRDPALIDMVRPGRIAPSRCEMQNVPPSRRRSLEPLRRASAHAIPLENDPRLPCLDLGTLESRNRFHPVYRLELAPLQTVGDDGFGNGSRYVQRGFELFRRGLVDPDR